MDKPFIFEYSERRCIDTNKLSALMRLYHDEFSNEEIELQLEKEKTERSEVCLDKQSDWKEWKEFNEYQNNMKSSEELLRISEIESKWEKDEEKERKFFESDSEESEDTEK